LALAMTGQVNSYDSKVPRLFQFPRETAWR